MADALDIPALIRERALANDVDPDVLHRMAEVESNLNPRASASTSSAKGLFQFINPTWQQYGNGADPFDPAASADAGARFMANNRKLLQSAGVDATPGALYLSHFAGPGGALKVLRSDPSARVASVLDASAVKANPFLANMSVSDLQAWADRKMSGAAPVRTASSVASVAPAAVGAAAPVGEAPLAPAESGVTPELMAQLQGIPKLLAQKSAMLEPSPQMQLPADRSAAARARIVRRALSPSAA